MKKKPPQTNALTGPAVFHGARPFASAPWFEENGPRARARG
jgi:hypothetical protein